MASFGLERALRITVGTPEENARLVEALRQVLGKGAARP
jgi:histidinol-phosphate/aromatic aminotransferase/cobyric acid decarboxylase-like protein